MRDLRHLKDYIVYRLERRRMSKLPEPSRASQETLWLITPDKQDSERGRMVQATRATVKKALALYVKHNSRNRSCVCRGCEDIRMILEAYLEGWSPYG